MFSGLLFVIIAAKRMHKNQGCRDTGKVAAGYVIVKDQVMQANSFEPRMDTNEHEFKIFKLLV